MAEPKSPRILGLIPARGGSKRLPRKNIALLGGKPLIQWSIESAQKSRYLTRTIVSTDDEEIATVAQASGAEVPFMRPANLSSDIASSVDVAIHATQSCEQQEGQAYDFVVLLQPTAPLRQAHEIDGCIDLLLANPQSDTAITVCPVGAFHPAYMYTKTNRDGDLFSPLFGAEVLGKRVQDMDQFFLRTGAVYVTRRDYLLDRRRIMAPETVGYICDPLTAANIDEALDLAQAERIIEQLDFGSTGALKRLDDLV